MFTTREGVRPGRLESSTQNCDFFRRVRKIGKNEYYLRPVCLPVRLFSWKCDIWLWIRRENSSFIQYWHE